MRIGNNHSYLFFFVMSEVEYNHCDPNITDNELYFSAAEPLATETCFNELCFFVLRFCPAVIYLHISFFSEDVLFLIDV